MKPDASHPAPFAILQCSVCHRTAEVTEGDFLAFAQTGWPRCCGEIMAVRRADEGSPDDER